MNLQIAIQHLERHLREVPEQFNSLTGDVVLQKPASNKWSKQEILGHLIDSALNNLKRFTEAQFLSQPYQVIRYQQDDVVAANRYQQLPLDHMLKLWGALNQQIFYVISNIPAEKLPYIIITPSGDSKTLEWLAIDYVEHMEHHLGQVFGK